MVHTNRMGTVFNKKKKLALTWIKQIWLECNVQFNTLAFNTTYGI